MKKDKLVLHNDFRNGKIYSQVLDYIISGEAVKATKYMSDKHIIRAKRKTYKGKIVRGNIEVVLTIGKPNFAEREFIKRWKKSKEKFPIKKVLLHYAK